LNASILLLQSESPSGKWQSFTLWQQATLEITRHDHSSRTQVVTFTSLISPEITRHNRSIVACSRHVYMRCYSSRTSRSWWIVHSTQRQRRGCNTARIWIMKKANLSSNLLGFSLNNQYETP